MIDTIYVEQEIASHPRTLEILQRYANTTRIDIDTYGEVFNRKSQNFRLQKHQPSLILAKKHKGLVLPTPKQYGIGAEYNYYFSHMLNCLYDCRYCFLQGMFQSAHYVLFVNYEDFLSEIEQTINKHQNETIHFFSGYDCDSLALDPLTGFIDAFLPFFKDKTNALIELRTKSTQARSLLKREAIENCVIAFSFTPEKISQALEYKVPAFDKRLNSMIELQQAGWQIGLRFDPLIYCDEYKHLYQEMFEILFKQLNPSLIHSVSLGSFRLPKPYFRKLEKLYPDDPLFAAPLVGEDKQIGYPNKIRNNMLDFASEQITKHIPDSKFFPCHEMPIN